MSPNCLSCFAQLVFIIIIISNYHCQRPKHQIECTMQCRHGEMGGGGAKHMYAPSATQAHHENILHCGSLVQAKVQNPYLLKIVI